ncbi:pyridoxal-phosphate dependent enzyme [Allosaccharopolyspora coralli]|uniref:Pyridoxal-phosphate dependent enzyme n=1 Tax=Allosaccharopolyspora coralli TaxID=2665642 RepID=A0A5Q3QF92_9PSEU|nr:pyridoxal-phosphate dependent enzyme [Allosaccharopolyspora coralli]QGK70119.1 pyridoxal-phosphate dependent enzyme [Allosaccharopolyspora coralli]
MYDHIAEAVSAPALVRLTDGLVCVRFETMKVISANAAVSRLLADGRVRRGDTLVDSSSGIYAYALALACHRHGLGCHIVGSTTVDTIARVQMEIMGATVEQVRPSEDLKLDQNLRVSRVREILSENPRHHWMRQYHDEVHYLGYREVADRIAREVRGEITLVGGVGSGASTGALATYLRRHGSVDVAGVQPFGSVTFGSDHVVDPAILIAGLGSSIPFGNVRHKLYDTVHWISFDAAVPGSVELLRRFGIFAGLSSGAGYLAARWERRLAPERTVVFVAADTGHRYVDSVFAPYRDAADVEELAPHDVTTTEALRLPWCRMAWNGSAAPHGAQFDECAPRR